MGFVPLRFRFDVQQHQKIGVAPNTYEASPCQQAHEAADSGCL